jgi:hypothetical protein
VSKLLLFPTAVARAPAIDAWFNSRPPQLGAIARQWFLRMRGCGADVRELLHDGHPTACVGDAAFAYTNVFTSHVNVGFFRGAELPDPTRLLQGDGKYMRHVKLRPGTAVDAASLETLITAAYLDIKARLASASPAKLPDGGGAPRRRGSV